ncbi:replication-associated protein [Crucivirus-380]|nr:replication-associated protein [Crucivirus-380]
MPATQPVDSEDEDDVFEKPKSLKERQAEAQAAVTTTTRVAASKVAAKPTPRSDPALAVRSMNFVFTCNNYTEGDLAFLRDHVASTTKYLMWGKEVSKSGTPHLQGTVIFKNQRTLSAVISNMGSRFHVEVCKDLFASIEYCEKDGDVEEHGVKPVNQKQKGDKEKERWAEILDFAKNGKFDLIDPQVQVLHGNKLQQVRAMHLRGLKHQPTFEQNYWFFGPTGSGKSRAAREDFPDSLVKMLNKWWDGYDSQETVILDDVDPATCERMGHWFKTWADHYPFPCEIKGAVMNIRPRRIVVTSNYTIEQCFPRPEDYKALHRRFTCVEFGPNGARRQVELQPQGGTVNTFVTPPPFKPTPGLERSPSVVMATATQVVEETDVEISDEDEDGEDE